MKLHVPTLALVGWYLMIPPMDDNQKPQTSAPLYQWDQTAASADSDEPAASFLTLAECEAEKSALKQSFLDESKKSTGAIAEMFLGFSKNASDAECVKSDDPRLDDPEMPAELRKAIWGK